MILPEDKAALNSSRLLPQSQNAIGSLANVRAATVETCTYATYPVSSTSEPVAYTFPQGVLAPGNCVRIVLFGTVSNAGAPNNFTHVLRVTQESATQTLGLAASVINDAQVMAWRIDAVVMFSGPGASNKGVARSGTVRSTFAATAGPNDTLAVGGLLQRMLTSTSFTNPDQAGGNLLAASTGTTQSLMVVTRDPNTTLLNNYMPIKVAVEAVTGPNVSYTVQGGWMEVM